jgi:hypothetical protein
VTVPSAVDHLHEDYISNGGEELSQNPLQEQAQEVKYRWLLSEVGEWTTRISVGAATWYHPPKIDPVDYVLVLVKENHCKLLSGV